MVLTSPSGSPRAIALPFPMLLLFLEYYIAALSMTMASAVIYIGIISLSRYYFLSAVKRVMTGSSVETNKNNNLDSIREAIRIVRYWSLISIVLFVGGLLPLFLHVGFYPYFEYLISPTDFNFMILLRDLSAFWGAASLGYQAKYLHDVFAHIRLYEDDKQRTDKEPQLDLRKKHYTPKSASTLADATL